MGKPVKLELTLEEADQLIGCLWDSSFFLGGMAEMLNKKEESDFKQRIQQTIAKSDDFVFAFQSKLGLLNDIEEENLPF